MAKEPEVQQLPIRDVLAETHDSTIRQEGMLKQALTQIEKHETRLVAVEVAVTTAKAQVGLIKWLIGVGFAAVGLVLAFMGKH